MDPKMTDMTTPCFWSSLMRCRGTRTRYSRNGDHENYYASCTPYSVLRISLADRKYIPPASGNGTVKW